MPCIKRIQQKLFWITLLVFISALNLSAQENWNLVKEEAGIKVFTKT